MASPLASQETKPDRSSEKPPAPLGRGSEEARKERDRRRASMRLLRRVLLALAALAVLVVIGLALRPRPVPVDVTKVTKGPLTVELEESGMTRVKDRYVVSVPVTGRIERISLEPGDVVTEGQALAEISPLESPLLDPRARSEAEARLGAALSAVGRTEAEIGRATAAHDQAIQDEQRAKRLYAERAIPVQQVEQAEFMRRMRAEELASAQFAAKVAKEEARLARVTLGRDGTKGRRHDHVSVLAPVSGKVLRVHQKSAGVVQAGTALLEVGDPSALEAVVDLLTTDAVHVREGTPVTILGWGGEHTLQGRVHRIEPSAFTRQSALGVDEQRVNVIIAFTDPHERWSVLGDGFRVEARVALWHGESVLQVPHGAVFRHGDGWAAFRIEGDTARRVPVEVGHRGEKFVEITRGLSPGDEVAVYPGDRVKDGIRIERR